MIKYFISSNIRRFLVPLSFFFVSIQLHSQTKCAIFDEKMQVAYSLNDSSLYTGICQDFFDNGRLRYKCNYDSGKIKTCSYWDRKGNLIDSFDYIISFKKYREFHYSPKKRLESICIFYLSKNKNDSVDFFDYEEVTYFYRNGNIKRKLKYYLDRKNRYLETKYYKNGNIKSSAVCYDIVTQITTNIGMSKILYDSTYTEYSKDGKKIKEIIYKEGEQISEAKF